MAGQYHWPPRTGDRVYQFSRANRELWPHGEIVHIERNWSDQDSSQVLVLFYVPAQIKHLQHGDVIKTYDGSNHWSTLDCPIGFIRLNGEIIQCDYKKFSYVEVNEELRWGGCNDLETFMFDQFAGNWSSSDGGNKRWEIE